MEAIGAVSKRYANSHQNPLDSMKLKKKKKKHRKNFQFFGLYIYKILKKNHPDLGISGKGMAIMQSFIRDIFERLASEASTLAKYSKRQTVFVEDIKTAVRLVIPEGLAGHAGEKARRSVVSYFKANKSEIGQEYGINT